MRFATGLTAGQAAARAGGLGGDPLVRWACSGVMALTGREDGPPLCPPTAGARRLDEVVAAIRSCTSALGTAVDLAWGPVLSGRAPLLGFHRRGRVSANGSCRLCRTTDGWVAVSLPRAEDVGSVEALTGGAGGADPWVAVEGWAGTVPTAEVVDRARLLGMPAAGVASVAVSDTWPWEVDLRWERAGARPLGGLRVVDLSSMWAGPLAAKVLADAGARVVKVESIGRPDGARRTPAFYEWLHRPGQPAVALDFTDDGGRSALRALLDQADVVIEASRPRALEQLGAGPADVAPRAGRTWLSITGYGRGVAARERVAFGDDAAAAGGLVARDAVGQPVFCGDAIADPVTGLLGGLAVLESVRRGGGELIDLAMARAAAWVAGAPSAVPSVAARASGTAGASGTSVAEWEVPGPEGPVGVAPPRPLGAAGV